MKKTFQIILKDSNPIIFDAVEKTTHETNIKVHDFFEQDIPCLILSIKHNQLNTLLDLTKTSPYTLIYFDNDYADRYYFDAAAYSNHETESAFFINTQFKKILFIPSSYRLSPGDIVKESCVEEVVFNKNGRKFRLPYQGFIEGYGKFPYIILKTTGTPIHEKYITGPGYADYTQIPIHFNTKDDFDNYPGTNIDNISDELLSEYEKDKTSELHDIIIKHCQWYITKLEADKKLEAKICLVEGPEIAYYFDGIKPRFSTVIPTGGTLKTLNNFILTINVNHYLE